MYKKILLLFLIILEMVLVATAAPRSKQWAPIYMASWSASTRLSSIWQYHVGDPQASRIFTLTNTKLPAQTLFSPQELAELRAYRETAHIQSDSQWGEQMPPSQQIVGVWRFDATHFLMQTTNDIRDPFGRGADNNENGRFGYHEFFTFDVNHPQQLQSLFIIDYHDRAYRNWEHCAMPFVYPTQITLNPTQNKMAFELTSGRDFCDWPYHDTVVIVDYSTSPIKLTRIPYAKHPVWSPDGTQLAYISGHITNVTPFRYDLSLEIRAGDTGQVTVVDTLSGLTDTVRLNTMAWADNETLVYEWYPSSIAGGDPAPLFKVYRSQQQQTSEIVGNDLLMDIGFLYPIMETGKLPEYLVGTSAAFGESPSHTFVLSSQHPLFTYKALHLDGTPLYNSRFPDRVLFWQPKDNYAANNVRITAFDLKFNIAVIGDLASILPTGEWVYDDVAP